MPHDEYEKITQGILGRLSEAARPLPAREVISALVTDGHDPAQVSFMIADLLNHGQLELDAQQRLRLEQTAVA